MKLGGSDVCKVEDLIYWSRPTRVLARIIMYAFVQCEACSAFLKRSGSYGAPNKCTNNSVAE